jgi:photosystem II stability/assembly factor-like uncharacterized protein
MMKTTNGGADWDVLSHSFRDSLSAVFFTNAETGYIAGQDLSGHGIILKTMDGGTNWDTLLSGSTAPLYSINFPDFHTGYAAGQCGTMLKTTDQGVTWTVLNSGTAHDLYSVCFTDVSTGYAVSDSGIIIKTINGGNSWNLLLSGTTMDLYSISFPNVNIGFAVGERTTVLQTTDKGEHWTVVCNWGGADLFTVNFIDPMHGFVGGDHNTLMRTSDGGLNWTNLIGGDYGWFFSVFMTDTNIAYAAGGQYQWGTLYKIIGDYSYLLTCGVKNWLLSVNFPDAGTGYVVGRGGTIFKTENGGGPVGVGETKNATNSLKLYPNPTSGNLTIEAPEKGTLSVFNLNGMLLMQRELLEPTTLIDVNTLQSGVYLLKLVGVKGVQVEKFIKQ